MSPATTTATTASPDLYRELDFRESDGIEVSLLWSPATDTLSVYVYDARTNDAFELPVRSDTAADAFAHPFAYRS